MSFCVITSYIFVCFFIHVLQDSLISILRQFHQYFWRLHRWLLSTVSKWCIHQDSTPSPDTPNRHAKHLREQHSKPTCKVSSPEGGRKKGNKHTKSPRPKVGKENPIKIWGNVVRKKTSFGRAGGKKDLLAQRRSLIEPWSWRAWLAQQPMDYHLLGKIVVSC